MTAHRAQHSLLVGEGTHELARQVKPSLPGKSLPAFYDCLPVSQGCLFGSSRRGPGWVRSAVFLWDFITCFVSQDVSVGLPSSSPLLHHYPLFSLHQLCIDPTHGRETTGSTWHLLEICLAKTAAAEPCYKFCVETEPFSILVMCLMGWGGDGVHAGPLLLLHSHLLLIPGSAQSSPDRENPNPPHTPVLGHHRAAEVWSGQPQRCWAQPLESMQCE